MKSQSAPICSEHRVAKEWLPTAFEYREDGISIRVPNVSAWVCPVDSEASFTPDTFDELIATVKDLLESAKRARSRRSALTEYVISVS